MVISYKVPYSEFTVKMTICALRNVLFTLLKKKIFFLLFHITLWKNVGCPGDQMRFFRDPWILCHMTPHPFQNDKAFTISHRLELQKLSRLNYPIPSCHHFLWYYDSDYLGGFGTNVSNNYYNLKLLIQHLSFFILEIWAYNDYI
jgi:hypothetical protein